MCGMWAALWRLCGLSGCAQSQREEEANVPLPTLFILSLSPPLHRLSSQSMASAHYAGETAPSSSNSESSPLLQA